MSAIITTSKLLADEGERWLDVPDCFFAQGGLRRASVAGATLDDAVCGAWAVLIRVGHDRKVIWASRAEEGQ